MATEPISFQRQFQILVDTLCDPQGQTYSVNAIARVVDLSEQALHYLLDGRSQSPRLDTLRRLCRFYHISIDYFDCDTEADCRQYLIDQIAAAPSSILPEIAQVSANLTPRGQHNVLRVMEWIRRGRLSGKHERKHQ